MEPLSAAEVAARLEAGGVEIESGPAGLLAAYLNLLEHWNRVHNLTGIRDRAALVDRHLVESLALAPYVTGPRVADIGSGAGLPGLPLAIRLRALHFTLIESRRKRVSFLRHVAAMLALENVDVAHGRVEELELPLFRTVLARAVAPPAELLELATPLLAPGGRLLYATCSVLTIENAAQTEGFVATHADAVSAPPGTDSHFRIATGTAGMDGFYYASLNRLTGTAA